MVDPFLAENLVFSFLYLFEGIAYVEIKWSAFSFPAFQSGPARLLHL